MAIDVALSPNFQKEAKRLVKKYPSLKLELAALYVALQSKPDTGIHLGNGIYKIRLGIVSKAKGKSGGGRVMSYYKIENATVLLFSIYSKGEKDNITDKEIADLLAGYK